MNKKEEINVMENYAQYKGCVYRLPQKMQETIVGFKQIKPTKSTLNGKNTYKRYSFRKNVNGVVISRNIEEKQAFKDLKILTDLEFKNFSSDKKLNFGAFENIVLTGKKTKEIVQKSLRNYFDKISEINEMQDVLKTAKILKLDEDYIAEMQNDILTETYKK